MVSSSGYTIRMAVRAAAFLHAGVRTLGSARRFVGMCRRVSIGCRDISRAIRHNPATQNSEDRGREDHFRPRSGAEGKRSGCGASAPPLASKRQKPLSGQNDFCSQITYSVL